MIHPVDSILSLVLLSVLFSFGSSRLPVLIKVLAFQGVVVSLVPLFIANDLSGGGILFTLVTNHYSPLHLSGHKKSGYPQGG